MILLKQLLIDCCVTQMDFARTLELSIQNVRLLLLHGQYPAKHTTKSHMVSVIETWVVSNPYPLNWLRTNKRGMEEIWHEYDGTRYAHKKKDIPIKALLLGDPLIINPRKDIEMILSLTLKHFKMFKNPFINDVNKPRDIYLSSEHRFLKEMMLDAAKFGGFVAVVGGVGSGKSVMRKAVAEQLTNDGLKVVYPLIIDKSRISPSSLIDAIVMDISDELPRQSLEQKTRQAVRLLKARADNGMRQVLMIEEAHNIDKRAFKALKQIFELENGYEKLIGIILIGQPELLKKLDEVGNADIREVIRRIATAEIEGLGKDVKPYLEHKFRVTGKKVEDILDDDVYDAINTRLERAQGRKKINRSFPLSVNNLVARAMNTAARMGEGKVTADLILNC